jgi:O-antigen/teichoic acid export membrane protein
MTLGTRIRTGVAWLLFGNTGGAVIQFLFGIALARLLVPADFGMIATIQILTGLVSLVSSAGMGQSLIRAKSAEPRDFDVVFTLQLGFGVLICAALFAVAPWFARFFDNALYADLLKVSALNFLLRPFANIRAAWLNREMNFKRAAVAGLTTALVSSGASVAMAFGGLGVWSLSLGGLVAAMTTNVVLYRLTPLRLKLRFDSRIARQHGVFGFNITMLDLLSHVRTESITLVLSKLAGPAFLGLFNKAENLARMPNRMITPATGQVVFRALAKVADDIPQSKYIMYRTVTLLSVYAWPFLLALAFVAEPLIVFLYGEKWRPAAEPARILAIGGFFLTMLRPCSVLLHAQNRLRQEMVVLVISIVFGLVACYLGLRWGLAGVAWAIVSTHLLSLVLTYGVVRMTIPTTLAELARAVAPAAILVGLTFIAAALLHFAIAGLALSAPFLYLAMMGSVGGAVYAAAFLLLPIPALRGEGDRWRRQVAILLEKVGLRRR